MFKTQKYINFHQTWHVQNFMKVEVRLILADTGLDSSSFHLMAKGEAWWFYSGLAHRLQATLQMLSISCCWLLSPRGSVTIGLCATLVCAVIGPCQPQRRAGYNIQKSWSKTVKKMTRVRKGLEKSGIATTAHCHSLLQTNSYIGLHNLVRGAFTWENFYRKDCSI